MGVGGVVVVVLLILTYNYAVLVPHVRGVEESQSYAVFCCEWKRIQKELQIRCRLFDQKGMVQR